MPAPHRFVGPIVALLLATGCAASDQPYFVDDVELSDPVIDSVVARLDRAADAVFTAEYSIITKFGDRRTTAVVTQDGDRRSITIGHIRFLVTPTQSVTCDLRTGVCSDGLLDAYVSDVQVTNEFWGRAMAHRLRTDADRNLAPATASEYDISGQVAVCAAVPVVGGVKSYCALESGVLAGYDGADLTIDLVSYSSVADTTLFSRGDL